MNYYQFSFLLSLSAISLIGYAGGVQAEERSKVIAIDSDQSVLVGVTSVGEPSSWTIQGGTLSRLKESAQKEKLSLQLAPSLAALSPQNAPLDTPETFPSKSKQITQEQKPAQKTAQSLPKAEPLKAKTPKIICSGQSKKDQPLASQEPASEIVQLYYLRNAKAMKELLTTIQSETCLPNLLITTPDSSEIGTDVSGINESAIILYGSEVERKAARRIITALDLPRAGIDMEMWGIQISSSNPERLADVMHKINVEINNTQQLLQMTYKEFEGLAQDISIDQEFSWVLQGGKPSESRTNSGLKSQNHREQWGLGFSSALDATRPLSMTDILLRLIAAKDLQDNAERMAVRLNTLFNQEEYKSYIDALAKERKLPFERFLRAYGMEKKTNCQPANDKSCFHVPDSPLRLKRQALRTRVDVLRFALQYGQYINSPNEFDPYYLQTSAENLNTALQPIVDAINLDVQDLFIAPTLARIQEIVRGHRDVEYALVGKTSVNGLSGLETKIVSSLRSDFEDSPPLQLGEILEKAGAYAKQSSALMPTPTLVLPDTTLPISVFVGMASALSENRSVWRDLPIGVNLTVTPNVLRNSASAELNITFQINDTGQDSTLSNTGQITLSADEQQGTGSDSGQKKNRPLSRIRNQRIDTTVYVNTLDLFTLSTFANQSTIDGGRSYIPILGTVWRGVFSGIPILGNLFSWKNKPKNIYHHSLILTNSFIKPTAMGLGVFYRPGKSKYSSETCRNVESSIRDIKAQIAQLNASPAPNFFITEDECPAMSK